MAYGLDLTLLEVNAAIDGADRHYILSGDLYDGIETETGLTKVDDPTGLEAIIPVKNLLRTGAIIRIGAKLTNGDNKSTAHLLISSEKLATLFTDGGGSSLDGKSVSRAGTSLGTIDRIFFPMNRYLIPS